MLFLNTLKTTELPNEMDIAINDKVTIGYFLDNEAICIERKIDNFCQIIADCPPESMLTALVCR